MESSQGAPEGPFTVQLDVVPAGMQAQRAIVASKSEAHKLGHEQDFQGEPPVQSQEHPQPELVPGHLLRAGAGFAEQASVGQHAPARGENNTHFTQAEFVPMETLHSQLQPNGGATPLHRLSKQAVQGGQGATSSSATSEQLGDSESRHSDFQEGESKKEYIDQSPLESVGNSHTMGIRGVRDLIGFSPSTVSEENNVAPPSLHSDHISPPDEVLQVLMSSKKRREQRQRQLEQQQRSAMSMGTPSTSDKFEPGFRSTISELASESHALPDRLSGIMAQVLHSDAASSENENSPDPLEQSPADIINSPASFSSKNSRRA